MNTPPPPEIQSQEVRRVISEMRRSARRLGPCATSYWLSAAAATASRVLAEWESEELSQEP